MKNATTLLNLLVLALCTGAFATPARAQPEPTAIQKTETSVAVVESVDHNTRQVLLSWHTVELHLQAVTVAV
jgi:hypothetical protein